MSDLITYQQAVDFLNNVDTITRELRRSNGMSLRDMEAATGLSSSTIKRIEDGHTVNIRHVTALLTWAAQRQEGPTP